MNRVATPPCSVIPTLSADVESALAACRNGSVWGLPRSRDFASLSLRRRIGRVLRNQGARNVASGELAKFSAVEPNDVLSDETAAQTNTIDAGHFEGTLRTRRTHDPVHKRKVGDGPANDRPHRASAPPRRDSHPVSPRSAQTLRLTSSRVATLAQRVLCPWTELRE